MKKKAKILVVEDEMIIASDIQSSLERIGYAVSAVVSSGKAALREAEECRPDLVLMDIVLKGKMSGIDAAEQIHSRLDIPVVYLTSYADEKTLERAKRSDPYGYLLKPFEDRELRSTIKMAMHKHEVEKELKESKERYKDLVEKAGVAILMDDEAGGFRYFNDTFVELFGYSVEEMKKQSIRSIVHPDDVDTVIKLHKARLQGKSVPSRYEFKGVRKDGSTVYLEVNAVVIREGERVVGTSSYLWDITERVEAEKRLKESMAIATQAREQLEKLEILRSQFKAIVMSHELRTPLNGIWGCLCLLMEEKEELTPEQQEWCEIAHLSTQKLLSVVDKIADYEERKADIVTPTENWEEVDIVKIFENVKTRIKASFPKMLYPLLDIDKVTNEHVKTQFYSQKLKCKPKDLEDVLFELLGNAIVASGTIEKSRLTGVKGIIHISTKEKDGMFYLTVEDKGRGIPKEEQEKVWEPYYGVGTVESHSSNYRSVGLGLSHVKNIVRHYLGDARIDSKVKDGTKVTVSFRNGFTEEDIRRRYTERELEILQMEKRLNDAFKEIITKSNMLRESEEGWRDSFNSLEDTMLVIDKDYNIENINDTGLKFFGKSKRVEKTIKKANGKPGKLDQLKSDFLSTVSHELRTPIAIMREGVSLCLDGIAGEITENQRELLTDTLENIDRLSRLVTDLLDVSRIEAGKITLRRSSVDLCGVVRKIYHSLKNQAREKNVRLKMDLPGESLKLYVDEDKVTQIFTNLISNAIRFTESGGQVTIGVREKESGVECSVSDTGIGIAEEDISKLFSKFEQFGRVEGPGYKGTGLGLAIAKGLAEKHGGKIWVESELGKGTTFWFTLGKVPFPKILIVDDEQQIVGLIKKFLKTDDYRFVETYRGEETVEKAQTQKPYLIILDMKLPGISGYEVIGRLKQDTRTYSIPILIISGYQVDEEQLVQVNPHTAIPVIKKPLRQDELRNKVKSLLVDSGMRDDR